jgi:hypothetical protein
LDRTPFGDRIHYSEFERDANGDAKDIDIKEIISCLICFDAEAFDDETHPIKAYSGGRSVLKHFAENDERLKKYCSLLPDVLELYDEIQLHLPDMYNGYLGAFKGVKRTPIELPYLGATADYDIPQ